ncbi:MAG: acyl-CoA dehydrogenase family protein [Flavobacteriales bacterium]|nr:acyl-CoA dehydrogenase family protein [Flavobacteriales bacterium]
MALKGGEFLIKDATPNEVFIPEDFNEEQRMMANAATEFIEKEVVPQRERFEKKDYEWTEQLMKQLGEMGLLGIGVPENYGGLGMDFNTTMLICDRVSGVSGSLSTAYGAHTGIGTLPILLYGTEEQKQKYLPKLASGEWMGCYCLTEPGAGSDANSGKTTAKLTDDGEHYIINGQKMWISNAGFADLFIVFARIEDDKNITAFIVEKGSEGLELNPEEEKMGIRASSTRQVFFNDVKVPVNHMLSERGNGFKIAMNALNVGRIKLSVACMDSVRRITTLSTQYANERLQFGQPIAQFGAIKSKLAEMASKVYAAESMTYRAGQEIEDNINRLLAEGADPQTSKLKGVEEYAIECAIAKVHGSEVLDYVVDEGVQVYGGMGFSEDAPMSAAYRDARIARIYEGTNEINRMLTVGMILKKALKGELDLVTPAMNVANELMSIPSFDTPDYDELLAEEQEVLGKLKKAILMVAGKAVETFGTEIEEEQEIMMNVADMIIETYAAESAMLRTLKLAKTRGEDKVKGQVAMTQLYVYNAIEEVARAGCEAIGSFAEGADRQLLMMGLKRFTKPLKINIKEVRRTIADELIEANKYCFSIS